MRAAIKIVAVGASAATILAAVNSDRPTSRTGRRSVFWTDATTAAALLPHQQEVFDILKVHAQQGGLCLVLGEPGTGKSVLKQTLLTHDPKRIITPVVNRTLHTYHNTLRILCEAFQIEFEGRDHHCERLLVQQAFSVHRAGKMLVLSGTASHLRAAERSTVMVLGGEPLGERYLYWNFVSSSKARLAQAAADWKAGRMKLPDLDHDEFIPLPDQPAPPAPAFS